MNRQEINLRIAKLVFPNAHEIKGLFGRDSINVFSSMVTFPAKTVDYCNNWNDLMLEVEKVALKIETFDRGTHTLVRVVIKDNSNSFTGKGDDLQIALALCLLKVLKEKEKEKEKDNG